MRRLLGIVLAIAVIGLPALASDSASWSQITLPGTNTPRPGMEHEFTFATNTPSGPTWTPSLTRTPTETATATPTATFTPTNTLTPTDTPSPTPTPNGPFVYPEGVNPLTGLPYPDEEAMARRNLIVKISNFPPVVRPQSGVNAADVVFEYEAEGGVTRFAAIFRSQTAHHVGPVRSARLIDLELAPMYEALLAYSGSSEPIHQMIMTSEWRYQAITPMIGDNCEEAGFCRFPQDGLAFEHTLYVDLDKVWERATARNVNTGYRARGFAFSETPDPGGQPANDVYVDWYGQTDGRWQYDPETGRYLRFTDGVPHFDAADGQQLWADNLIIIEVPHNDRPDLFEPESRTASLEIALWDQGRAYLVRDGMYWQGFWRRRSRDFGDALQIIYGNNTPIMMKPGRTWVMVVRGFGDVVISEERVDVGATATQIALSATPTQVVATETAQP